MQDMPFRLDPALVIPCFHEIGGQFNPRHALQPSHLSGPTFSAGLGLIPALLNSAQGLCEMITEGPSLASSSLIALIVFF
jgi:hypothetical protein